MYGAHLSASATLLLFAGFVVVEALKLQYYSPLGPGAGFFAFWLGVALAAASAAMLVRTLRRPPPSPPAASLPDRDGRLRLGAVLAGLVATVLLLDVLGYRLTMLGVYLCLLPVLGQRGWVVTPLVALAGSFGVYHAFVHWLNVPLPPGPFGK